MNFNNKEDKDKLRKLIAVLAEKMHGIEDPWLLKDCTARSDSWYNRHNKTKEKMEEKKEKTILKLHVS